MKENQGWREAYNKIIFEQVDINEETIPNFIQQEINKAVLEALQKRDESIIKMLENTDVQMSVNGDVSKDEIAMAKFIYKAHIKHIIKNISTLINKYMTEEIKQKAREELRELFPLEYLRNEIDNFGYASLENWIDDLLSQALQKQRKEIIKLIKTPMSTEFEDPEEESADYSIEDFRARLLSTLTTK